MQTTMAKDTHTAHQYLSPEFTLWLYREKKLAHRRQVMIRGFAFALVLILMTAVLFSRFGEESPVPGDEGYTLTEYTNY